MALNDISLKWSGYQSNILSNLKALFQDDVYADVTLVAESESLKAHKVILSASSPLFKSIFNQNPFPHPIIVLHDLSLFALRALIAFIYNGEVNVAQERLPELLKAAETLKVRGLSVIDEDSCETSKNSDQFIAKCKEPWNAESLLKSSIKEEDNLEELNESCINMHGSGELIPKEEPPDSICVEAILEGETNKIDSDYNGSRLIINDSVEDSYVLNANRKMEVSSQKNPNSKQGKIKSKKLKFTIKNHIGNQSKVILDRTEAIINEDSVEFGKENISEDQIEKEIENVLHSNIVVEAYTGVSNYDQDMVTDCNEVSSCAEYISPKFPCPFCARIYHTWGYRRRHVKSRHRTTKLSCKWCLTLCSSQALWFEHVVAKHGVDRVEARDYLVILVEAHAVLTSLSPPSPSSLLGDIHMDEQTVSIE